MLKVILVGNLGANAEVKETNGRKFISFKVADSRKFTRADGTEVEETTWVSCILNGDGGALFPYLTQGAKVMVTGRASFDVYSSPKLRRMVAGVNLSVDSIELIGGLRDAVPHQLVSSDGALVDVLKYYWVEQPKEGAKYERLYTPRGQEFQVTPEGWVSPIAINSQSAPAESETTVENQAEEQQNSKSSKSNGK